eukprot:scaffold127591_cov63-Phaeocystis_antarctica.AAC.4
MGAAWIGGAWQGGCGRAVCGWGSGVRRRRHQRQRHQNGPWLRRPPIGSSPSGAADSVNDTKRHRRHPLQRRRQSSGEVAEGHEPWSLVAESQSPTSGPMSVQKPGTECAGADQCGGGGGGGSMDVAALTCRLTAAAPPKL